MARARWIGWEYLNKSETHVIISKRHIQKIGKYGEMVNRAVCGVKLPEFISTNEGDYGCEKCEAWLEKHLNDAEALVAYQENYFNYEEIEK